MPYLLSLLFLFPFAPTVQRVAVEVTTPTAGGAIYLAAYADQDGFDRDESVANVREALNHRERLAELEVAVPRKGDYLFAAFQDLNGNGRLDVNLLGVPTEPYGFGKLPPSKWRAPSFGEVATTVDGGGELRIELRRWSEY